MYGLAVCAVLASGCATPALSPPTASMTRVVRIEQEVVTTKFHMLYDSILPLFDSVGYALATAAAPWCPDDALRREAGYYAWDHQTWRNNRNSRYRYIPAIAGTTVQRVIPGSPAHGVIAAGDVLLETVGSDAMTTIVRAGRPRTEEPFELSIPWSGPTDTVAVTVPLVCAMPHYVEHDQVNAFTDGKEVYVLGGMVRYAHNRDELAFVVAHELAHVAADHVEKTQRNRLGGALLGALVGAVAEAFTGVSGTRIANSFAEAEGVRYSIDFEREADYLATALMMRAGFDPKAGAGLWARIIRESQDLGHSLTHPSYAARHLDIQLQTDLLARCAERLGGLSFLNPTSIGRCWQ